MIGKSQFVRIYEALKSGREFEFQISGRSHEYMIIKYDDGPTVARCGIDDGSGEVQFATIGDLLNAEAIDGLCLSRDWELIESIVVDATFDLSVESHRMELGVEKILEG